MSRSLLYFHAYFISSVYSTQKCVAVQILDHDLDRDNIDVLADMNFDNVDASELNVLLKG